ncbi:MAG: DUF5119 domain-containing protein [Rikenellaceae bacterium]
MKSYNKLFSLLLSLIVSALVISCDTSKRPILEDTTPENNYVDIPTDIDWSDIGTEPTQYTLIFYPTDGSEKTVMVVDSSTPTVSVKKNEYSIIIFNGTFSSHSGLTFEDVDGYKTIKASLVNATGGYADVASYDLYTDSMDYIDITSDTTKLSFELTKTTTAFHLTAYASSINLLSTEGNFAVVTGFAKGLYLYNNQPADGDTISVNMPLSSLVYNTNSIVDGYLRDQTVCFGIYSSEEVTPSNNASLYFELSSGGIINVNVDITDSIKSVNGDNERVLSVEISDINIE